MCVLIPDDLVEVGHRGRVKTIVPSAIVQTTVAGIMPSAITHHALRRSLSGIIDDEGGLWLLWGCMS